MGSQKVIFKCAMPQIFKKIFKKKVNYMSESEIGILLLIGLGFLSSIITYVIINNFIKTCVISSLVASIVFCIIAEICKPDPLIIIALFFGSFYCFIISFVIGLPFYFIRKEKAKRSDLHF